MANRDVAGGRSFYLLQCRSPIRLQNKVFWFL